MNRHHLRTPELLECDGCLGTDRLFFPLESDLESQMGTKVDPRTVSRDNGPLRLETQARSPGKSFFVHPHDAIILAHNRGMVLSVTLNPCVDYTLFVKQLQTGDTNRIVRQEVDAGGKGVNLSRVVAELGLETAATGFLGGNPGQFVRRVLREQGVVDEFLEVSSETRRNFSIESIEVEVAPTTFNAAGEPVSPEDWTRLQERVSNLAAKANWVAMGGSLPPGVPVEAYLVLGNLARAAGARILLDADGEAMRAALPLKPDLIKPNQHEAERMLNRSIESEEEILQAACDLQAFVEPENGMVLLSLGEAGAVLAAQGKIWRGTSPNVKAISTIGAGDSFLAGFLVGLQKGDLAEALRLALASGAATASTNGTEIARAACVERLLPEAVVRLL